MMVHKAFCKNCGCQLISKQVGRKPIVCSDCKPAVARLRASTWYANNKDRQAATTKIHREKNKEAIALRKKQDRESNPEKFRVKDRQYYQKHRRQLISYQKQYASEHREQRREIASNWAREHPNNEVQRTRAKLLQRRRRAANPEKVKEEQRTWRRNNKDRAAQLAKASRRRNREKISERNKQKHLEQWQVNPQYRLRCVNNTRNRRAKIKQSPGTHSLADIQRLLELQNGLCAAPWCKQDLRPGYHVDHVMPIALGGSNGPENLQLLCPDCNRRKRAKHPEEWRRENILTVNQ